MTAENFGACLDFTLKYEGGKSDDPRDPGGRTMEGVTQTAYDAFRAKYGLPKRDVYMMPKPERDAIYRREYWDRVDGDALRAGEDLCVFDFAVNSGPARALGAHGKLGSCALDAMIHGICARRLSILHALRTWRHFGAGWGRRVAACEALALRMAHRKEAGQVLAREGAAARAGSGKKSTQAVVGGTIMGSAAIAHAANGGMSGTAEICILIAAACFAGIFLFHAWRQGQRARAFAAEAKQ